MPTFTWRLLDQDPTRYDDNPENHASGRGNAKACPLYLRKRTFAGMIDMSAKCQ